VFAALIVVSVSLSCKNASAGEFVVRVYDIGQGKEEGIPLADVGVFELTDEEWESLKKGDRLPEGRDADHEKVTDGNGKYEVKHDGTRLLVRVRHVGFVANPTDKLLMKEAERAELLVPLMNSNAIDVGSPQMEYIANVVRVIRGSYGAEDVKAQWDALRLFKLPPPTKRLFAMEFVKQQPNAAEKVSAINDYLQVDPGKLNRMHRIFDDSLRRSVPRLPDRSAAEGIPNAIVTDAFTDLLDAAQLEERRTLIEGFRRELRPNGTIDLDRSIRERAVDPDGLFRP
jgi:hypothetical protein